MAVRDTAHRKLTYEDYAQIPDDGKRHEIIDGEHYVSPSPNADHQDLSRNRAAPPAARPQAFRPDRSSS
jgi:hypothetical protein